MEYEYALIRIKILLSKYYESVGREHEDNEIDKDNLIEQIDEMVNDVKLSNKKLIIERLELDRKLNNEEKKYG